MPTAKTNLLLRNDTILGVCEAVGQDFGFHPNWLRLALASMFYWFPLAVVGGYLSLGVVVAISRWVSPDQAEAVPASLHALPTEPTGDPVDEPVALAA